MRCVLNRGFHLIGVILSLCILDNISAATRSDEMQVTLLGTGTPFPNVERFGSAILVKVAGKRLLFDCGRGAVIRLTQAGVNPKDIDGLFLTHLHSDHVVGIPDLWLSEWFLGRNRPLPIWGPSGTHNMAEHLVQAFAFDIGIRQAAPDPLPAKGVEIDAKEVTQGEIYNDGLTRVSAFLVDHGVKPAFGYRVDSEGHSVVISGDTKFCQNLVDFAKGAGLPDPCCLERWLEEPYPAIEAFNCFCRRCGTRIRDREAQAWCRLSLQGRRRALGGSTQRIQRPIGHLQGSDGHQRGQDRLLARKI
jgi:phosphoribosyl 1,2-cyclic phosphodiesterase